MCFLYADSFFLRIYYEDCIRKTFHVFDSAKVLLKFLPLFFDLDNFFLRQYIKCSILRHSLNLFETGNSALDCLEVCKHSSKPSLIYIIHSAAFCFYFDCILSLFLCSYEKDCSALCCNIRYCIVSLINFSYRFL